MDEKQRRALFPTAQKWCKALSGSVTNELNGISRLTLWRTAPLAMLGTASLTELKKARLTVIPELQVAVEILESRRPDWLQPYCMWLLEQNPISGWPLVRHLLRKKRLPRPEGDSYVIGMIASARRGAYDLLTSEPDLLGEVPRLFEVEGAGEHSLAAFDKYSHPDQQWATALQRLSKEGRLSRERLLSDSLRALTYGFASFRAGWYSRFYEQLKPTPDETAANLDSLYLLLGSPIPTTASFALKTLHGVAKKHKLSAEKLWSSLGPVWTLAQKGSVLRGLKLLAATPPGEAWLEHLTQAAAHPAAEVQTEALKLLKKVAPKPAGQWRERWLTMLAGLEPSVREEWAGWLAADEADRASVEMPHQELPEPEDWAAVVPCADLQEVFDLAARLLEEAGPPHDIERLLDGLTRFPGKGHRQAPTLLKRIKTRLSAVDIRSPLAAVLSSWLGQPEAVKVEPRPRLQSFLEHRLAELARALQLGMAPLGLHSLPELESGSLSASTLAQRLARHPQPMPWDFTQAILRLDLASAPGLASGEPGDVIAYALGEPYGKARRTAQWWQAADLLRASRSGQPWSVNVKVTTSVYSGKTYHHRQLRVPELERRGGAGLVWKDEVESAESVRWQSTISPALRESFQLQGIEQIANNLDWWGADWSDRVYLETLLQPAETWSRAGLYLAALGLSCKEAGQRGLAVDAVAQGLSSGRLSPAALGEVMARVSDTGMITARRWATSFDELRRFVSGDSLFETLQAFFAAPPRTDFDSKPLLGPLLEIGVGLRRSVSDARARTTLEGIKGGKAGKQVAQLLEVH
jgi:hypothetical protein